MAETGEKHYNEAESNVFLLFILLLIAVPSTFLFIKRKILGFEGAAKTIECQCSLCKQGSSKVKKAKKGGLNVTTIVQGLLLVGLWALFFYIMSNTSTAEEPEDAFDPYKILGLDYGATTQEIKKAYREMSLKYHPDKAADPTDPAVQTRYITIVKANEALTDEIARANWEKYGNPDGPRPIVPGIALPPWLVRKDNNFVVLAVYLTLLIVGLPAVVCFWWRSWKKFDSTKVMNSTMGLYYHKIEQIARVKVISELIGASQEYQAIPIRGSDDQCLTRVAKMIPDAHSMKRKPKYTAPYAIKANALFYAQMSRLQSALTPGLKEDLDKMLVQARPLLGGLITICTAKSLSVPILESLQFLQQLTQSTWNKEDLLQLPHITPDIVDICNSKKKNCGELSRFIALGEEKRKALLIEEGLNDAQIGDVETVLAYLPNNVKAKFECAVEGEEGSTGKVLAGTIVTCFFTVTRGDDDAEDESDSDESNSDEEEDKEKAEKRAAREKKRQAAKKKSDSENDVKRMVHAPHFPEPREESWWVVIADAAKYELVGVTQVGNFGKRHEGKIKFMAPQKPGTYNFTFYLICDGYLGCDRQYPVKLNVIQDDKAIAAAAEAAKKLKGIKGGNKGLPTIQEEDGEFSDGSDYSDYSDDEDLSDSDDDDEPKKKK